VIRRLTSLAEEGGGSNENISDTLLVGSVCCNNVTSWASDSVLIGDARATRYSEIIDHGYLAILNDIGFDRLSCLADNFLDWELGGHILMAYLMEW
jgi:hypothetical protein